MFVPEHPAEKETAMEKGYIVKEYSGCALVIFTKAGIENGFNVRSGFAGLIDTDSRLFAVTSGCGTQRDNESYECFRVYRKSIDGWTMSYEDEETFPVSDTEDALDEYSERADYIAACQRADEIVEPLYNGDAFSVTDAVAGEKSNDGGEYGFWTDYLPTDHVGVYRVSTDTTCELPTGMGGYNGYIVITAAKQSHLMAQSVAIEAAGSQY